MLQGPAFRPLLRGVYVRRDVEVTEALVVRGALKVLPEGTVAVSVTALRLHGLELGPHLPLRFCTVAGWQVRRAGLVVSRVRRLPPSHDHLVTAEAAFVTSATVLSVVELVVAGDWLVRFRGCTPASLLASATSAQGRGARAARRAAALVRQRVDSPPETRLRLLLVLSGLPEPACNLAVGDDLGPVGKADLVYVQFRVLIEYEGDQHRTDTPQWNLDIDRQEAFAALGYALLRVTAARMRRPRDLVQRVHTLLRAGGYRGPAPVFSAEWSALFETSAHFNPRMTAAKGRK